MKILIDIDSNIGGWTERRHMKKILQNLTRKISSTKETSGIVLDENANVIGTWKVSGEEIDAELDDAILRGEEAESLLNDLEDHCSPEEAKRRIESAEHFLNKLVSRK